MGVKREDATGNDPENGSPDADRGGRIFFFFALNVTFFIFFLKLISKTLI